MAGKAQIRYINAARARVYNHLLEHRRPFSFELEWLSMSKAHPGKRLVTHPAAGIDPAKEVPHAIGSGIRLRNLPYLGKTESPEGTLHWHQERRLGTAEDSGQKKRRTDTKKRR